MPRRIGVIGFGEVGEALAHELIAQQRPPLVFEPRPERPQTVARAESLGLEVSRDPEAFATAAGVVVVVVPAPQALASAELLVPHLGPAVLYSDWTAKGPQVRDRIAAICGERPFADVAIAGTVTWADRDVDLLVSGSGSDRLAAALEGTRFRAVVVDPEVPRSCEIKLCRSALTKGLSALMIETFVAAHRLGVLDLVDEGLGPFFGDAYPRLRDLMIVTAIPHASRRAAEMEDAAGLVSEALGSAAMTTASRDVLGALVPLQAELEGRDAGSWREIIGWLDDHNGLAALAQEPKETRCIC